MSPTCQVMTPRPISASVHKILRRKKGAVFVGFFVCFFVAVVVVVLLLLFFVFLFCFF